MIYLASQTEEFLAALPKKFKIYHNRSKKNPKKYIELLAAFDTESTSYKVGETKTAWTYVWMLAIEDNIILGRTLDEFEAFTDRLAEYLELRPNQDEDPGQMLAIYIHNEAFDFQFIKDRFLWKDVFALDNRKPVRALAANGIEFRCSYVLSGLSLANLPIKDSDIKKLVGGLEYGKIRHSETPLTQKEIDYCCADVAVIIQYIREKLRDNKDNLAKIPMTRTGYVRRDVRRKCLKSENYKRLMKSLTITLEQYHKLKKVFQGGFTHANIHYANITLENVDSYDFTSSYPAVMVSEKYPMSPFMRYVPQSDEDFYNQLDKFACMFKLELFNVSPKLDWDNPISLSKCVAISDEQHREINNGRVRKADYLAIYVNEVDFRVIEQFYNFDKTPGLQTHFKVSEFERAYKDYLPLEYMLAVLEYYELKTTKKHVEGEEVMYEKYKEFVNSLY